MNKTKSVKYILSLTLGTLAGSLAGYSFGRYAILKSGGEVTGAVKFLFNSLPGFSESSYYKIHLIYAKWNFLILIIAASTPIPYGFFSITSGIFEMNFIVFCFSTLFCQGIKFLVLTLVTLKSTPEIMKFLRFKQKPIAGITTILFFATVIMRVF